MASTISFSGTNSGFQIGRNDGNITAQFNYHIEQSETSADQACLQDLQTTNPRYDKARIEMVKGGLLNDAYSWILGHDDFKQWRYEQQSQLLWIKGDPGKGKTMLLCGIIDELTKSAPNTSVISFFFCQATDVRINHATAVLRGLIFMLVDQQPHLICHVRRQYDKAGKQVFEDINAWEALSEIITAILEDPLLQPITTYLIIDALDECTTGLDRLLELVVQKSAAYSNVKWIVSSRNWPVIEESLGSVSQKTTLRLELNETSIAQAVTAFIHYKVQKLTEKKKYNDEIRDAVSQHLLANAYGTFLWVALVCEQLANTPKRNVRKKLEEFPPGLDELYKRMFTQISDSDDAELCKSLLGIVTTVYRPITLDELASCIDLSGDFEDDSDLADIIGLCGSFLTLRGRIISLVHQSVKDFLVREAAHEIFPNGQEIVHYSIFSQSLEAISRSLRRDIYDLVQPGYPIDQVNQPDPDPLATVRYACIYWVNHLNECSPSENAMADLQDSGSVGNFFQNDYLYWLEALSLLKCLSEGVASILRLDILLKTTSQNSQLTGRVVDAYRFILYHKTAIENQPLQVYASGLVFSPTRSITRTQFEIQEPAWIISKPTMEKTWSASLQTLEGHTRPVSMVAFSSDSKFLVSISDDHTVKVWDTSSGQCRRTLEWNNSSAVFSHDSKLLASASGDWTVKVWDVSSGQCLQTLKGHNERVNSVVFSHDAKLLASASDDCTVRVWDASSGQCLQTLEGHSVWVNSVVFSHDSKLLASASDDQTIRVWDATDSQCIQIMEGYSERVSSVTFSYDSKLLVSTSRNSIIKVWDITSGRCLQTLEGHNDWADSVIFSHDSKRLVSASRDYTIKVWDVTSGRCLQTLEGHSSEVNSVIFSHDFRLLASSSSDCTVKVWDANSGQCLQTLEGHNEWVNSVVFSCDSKLLASASDDCTVRVWDASSVQSLQKEQNIECHRASVNSVVFSYDSKLLATASDDRTVKVWDASNGQCLQTFKGHSKLVYSVAFSQDNKLLASASDDRTIKIWDATSGQCIQSVEGHSKSVNLVSFSHDSKLLASASHDRTVKVWDATSGRCLQTFPDLINTVQFIVFSYDSKLLAFSLFTTVKVYDISSAQCIQTMEGHDMEVYSIVFSRDSTLLASSAEDSIIKVWDTSSGQCLQTIYTHSAASLKSFDISKSYLEADVVAVLGPFAAYQIVLYGPWGWKPPTDGGESGLRVPL
ncbi:hypothetical protein N7462_008358 [Penicillium macrosclerotiorum]|uniref:uncharacterized protein n=1 Tax=Penicillium macrosclerotiorum TaxID=303699 RepID=UPI0025481E54|nr:uncharacterized protein N7462_008358 [Penicillium macrosclerotiorum]KAJ5675461.1 hypothetical protein N7462_008358 [Penicillium macrosclerotiorum]